MFNVSAINHFTLDVSLTQSDAFYFMNVPSNSNCSFVNKEKMSIKLFPLGMFNTISILQS